VVNVFSANTLLHEVVSFTRWIGVLFISIGVVLVLRSGGQKIQQEREEILRRDQ
jgi:drug/metabolite transporter (DMT)-like permease